ncbi:MAG: hypothetical protein BMS9Abin05_2343 [Rhodothermia bacterium]|nr:MAG: hypothetical protein BMS9Abin05_2343 [Rhodothermia bacterium]
MLNSINLSSKDIRRLLQAVRERLHLSGFEIALIIVGGANLNVMNIVARTTKDVDVIAQTEGEGDELTIRSPLPFPEPLTQAIETVARDFNISSDWMNAEVAAQWNVGMPDTILDDLTWRKYSALKVGFAGRQTIISLKLFAAADRSPASVHAQDLVALRPTDDELLHAADWVKTQDASEHFSSLVDDVIRYVKRDRE